MIATSFNLTSTTYETIYLDVHSVGVRHDHKDVAGPYAVATAINQSFSAIYNKKYVGDDQGSADNDAPWTSMLTPLTHPTVITDTVESTYNGTLPAGKYLVLDFDVNGNDGKQIIRKTVYGVDNSGDVPVIFNTVAIISREGYIRTGTFISFSISN